MRLIYDDRAPVKALGEAEIKRASHVEPYTLGGRVCWLADLAPVGGPVLGIFRTREQALEAEKEWLNEQLRRP